jgi:hypothetical protein
MSANSMVALAGSAIGAAISAMIGPVITFPFPVEDHPRS